MANGVKWRVNSWFPVLRYGFCPSEEIWQVERARALRDGHVELGDYPVSESHLGMTTTFLGKFGNPHALLALDASLDDQPVRLASVIAHECVHMAEALSEKMEDRCPSEEFRAYVVGAFVAEMFEDYSLAGRGSKKARD